MPRKGDKVEETSCAKLKDYIPSFNAKVSATQHSKSLMDNTANSDDVNVIQDAVFNEDSIAELLNKFRSQI